MFFVRFAPTFPLVCETIALKVNICVTGVLETIVFGFDYLFFFPFNFVFFVFNSHFLEASASCVHRPYQKP